MKKYFLYLYFIFCIFFFFFQSLLKIVFIFSCKVRLKNSKRDQFKLKKWDKFDAIIEEKIFKLPQLCFLICLFFGSFSWFFRFIFWDSVYISLKKNLFYFLSLTSPILRYFPHNRKWKKFWDRNLKKKN